MPRLQQRLGDMGPADRAFTRYLEDALEADRRTIPSEPRPSCAGHPALADAPLGVEFRGV